jgi:hypothetical protein
MLSDTDIQKLVQAVLAADETRHAESIEAVVAKAMTAVLKSFGIDEEDHKELRADFEHLRKWRKSVEQAQSLTFRAIITAIVGGLIGAAWLGFKTVLALKS